MKTSTDVKVKKEPTTKIWYTSKTLWTNFFMAAFTLIGSAVPAVKPYLTPENLTGAFTVVNLILRFVTKDKLVIS